MLDLPGRRGRQHAGGPPSADEALVFELAAFGRGPLDARRASWLIFELDAESLRNTLLPEYLHRHLGDAFHDYQMEAAHRAEPSRLFYRNSADALRGAPDAGLAIVDINYDELFRRLAPPGRGSRQSRGWPRPTWAGCGFPCATAPASLDAVVGPHENAQPRRHGRHPAADGGRAGALILSTRRAQRLADMQMEFVTGVSHELRTPLTVIRTAAYNLPRKAGAEPGHGGEIRSADPAGKRAPDGDRRAGTRVRPFQVRPRRRGAATRVCGPTPYAKPLSACQPLIDASGCRVETDIAEGLPRCWPSRRRWPIRSRTCFRMRSSTEAGGRGSSAARRGPMVEICVADRGPGIPAAELLARLRAVLPRPPRHRRSGAWHRPRPRAGGKAQRSLSAAKSTSAAGRAY